MEFIFYKLSISELQSSLFNSHSPLQSNLKGSFWTELKNFSFFNFNLTSNWNELFFTKPDHALTNNKELLINKKSIDFFSKPNDFIFTEIFEGFFSYLLFSSYISFLFTLPFFYYNIYKFLLPGISFSEALLFKTFFKLSLCLFLLGHLLTYLVILPYAMSFLLDFQTNVTFSTLNNLEPIELALQDQLIPEGTKLSDSPSDVKLTFLGRILPWIQFLIQIFTTVSFLFHLPLILFICFILITKVINTNLTSNWTSTNFKQSKKSQKESFLFNLNNNTIFVRKILFFLLVLITAIFSPPDIYSQLFLLIPLFIIIEIFIFLVFLYLEYKKTKN